MLDVRRGDVVLVSFPFVGRAGVEKKRRPAVVIQSDRYNRRRAAVILAAITSSQKQGELPSKVTIVADSVEGQRAGLRIDSVVDCQTLITLPRTEIAVRIGTFSAEALVLIDRALADALGLGVS